jgi:hypothetical protein
MATTRKNTQVPAPLRRPLWKGAPSSNPRSLEKHPAPPDPEEGHMGALETQVSRTVPPTADDDEPKQG